MGIKILIVVTCSSGIIKVNIAVLTKLNSEARFVAYLLLLIIRTKIFFCTNYFQFIVDKHSIILNIDINAHIIQYNTFKVFQSLN